MQVETDGMIVNSANEIANPFILTHLRDCM